MTSAASVITAPFDATPGDRAEEVAVLIRDKMAAHRTGCGPPGLDHGGDRDAAPCALPRFRLSQDVGVGG
jgi:hypothetical protein